MPDRLLVLLAGLPVVVGAAFAYESRPRPNDCVPADGLACTLQATIGSEGRMLVGLGVVLIGCALVVVVTRAGRARRVPVLG